MSGLSESIPRPEELSRFGAATKPRDERTYLAVPFQEKDEAKQLGARWDGRLKAWYVPAGMDLAAFHPWLPAMGEVYIAVDSDPREEFAKALRECGLELNGPPEMDGNLHRVPVEGDKQGDRSGAYFGHLDGRAAGFIQNFRSGVKTSWKASGAALAAEDRARIAADAAQKRHERALERERQYEHAAQEVDAIWAAAAPVQSHPYLEDKGVPSYGLRQAEDGRLLVPVQDADGKLWSLQRVALDHSKLFHEGGRVEGGHFVIGDVNKPGPLLIAEGYATAATVHTLTDAPVVVAFNAGNLASVARTYRTLFPDRLIGIAGDNDRKREAGGKPNVGREKAEQAAASIKGFAILPQFNQAGVGSDWNDLARGDVTEARLQLKTGIAIAEREALAREFGSRRERAEALRHEHARKVGETCLER
ncbi:MAG: toprim domain-containing protein [Acetobacteraceae bacterium]|nr:toprim domain-containing protein [Acetobacteraceae bacterium]